MKRPYIVRCGEESRFAFIDDEKRKRLEAKGIARFGVNVCDIIVTRTRKVLR